jgi:pilus assembly protein CpaF
MFGRRAPTGDGGVVGAPSGQASARDFLSTGTVPAPVNASPTAPASAPRRGGTTERRADLEQLYRAIHAPLFDRVDAATAARLPRADLVAQVTEILSELILELRATLSSREQQELADRLVDDMVGLGPLEPLINDETITDIMVNGPNAVYVERKGKIERTDIVFRDALHLMNIAQRIVTRVGRRVDETCPIADARLPDGSRVNIIAPPLAIDGCSISIRKFSKKTITLDVMSRQGNISDCLARILKIAAACRLNIIVSGGTGSGKTTMLNALSQLIDPNERIVTIEDAAELQLQQPHVVRLETRPPNLEGHGEVTMRDLVRNALRMRPDRIICGEVRGPEAIDMLQAMNTGHDGSMCTLHANNPREAITRIENMVGMVANLPPKAIRTQIVGAVNLIVQISRMRDGIRRVTHLTEIVGMEGEVVTTQDLITFEYEGENRDGTLIGRFVPAAVRPHFAKRAAYYGLDRALLAAMTG